MNTLVRPWPTFRLGASGLALALVLALAACGGGGGSPTPEPEPPVRQASADSPVAAGCQGGAGGGASTSGGTLYVNAEVEPFAAADPTRPGHLLAAWQQDRWSNGGARALVSAFSADGGLSWQRSLQPMSRCGGALPGSAGDFERVSDPWVDIGPGGNAYLLGLAISGTAFLSGSQSALLASRSSDGGRTWAAPVELARDGRAFFNDKGSLSADPTDARYVYAVWDRLDTGGNGPAMLARSTDGGASWEPARVLFAPGSAGISQTLGNRIVVIAAGAERGTLVDVFTQIDTVDGVSSSRIGLVRSADHGLSWGAPIYVAELRSVGASDAATGASIRDGGELPTVAAGPDGRLWVAWQDARFSGGRLDAIALSQSGDGGRSWSAPLAINRVETTPAFTPTLHVRADGTVGVMHYDLRNDTTSAATLIADAWLLTSRDGLSWTETHVAGPFDLGTAPDSGGLFLGDYQGLVSESGAFLPLLVTANSDPANRTDVFSPRLALADGALALSYRARAAHLTGTNAAPGSAPVGNEAAALQFRAARHAAIVGAMERRVPAWAARVQAKMPADLLR